MSVAVNSTDHSFEGYGSEQPGHTLRNSHLLIPYYFLLNLIANAIQIQYIAPKFYLLIKKGGNSYGFRQFNFN
jgi:hypothetical protein